MKYFIAIGAVILGLLEMVFCSACVPPFIDGLIEASEYFEETVRNSIYSVDPEADGGYNTADGDNLSLSALTDGDENNTVMERYYSFTFKTQDESFTLQGVAFIIEAKNTASFDFELKSGSSNFNQSIEVSVGKIGTVEFTSLNLEINAVSELTITLINPLLTDVPYRIDSLVFII